MGQHFQATSHQGAWALAWVFAGGATIASWGLSAFPAATWVALISRSRIGMFWGLGAGVAAWTGGFFAQDFWKPFSRYTFLVVTWMLRWIYPNQISDPLKFVVGTPSFSVQIAPTCSGLEGIGLILAFLSIYLWLFRREFQFPSALVLLPLGAAVIWLLNALRIAALVVIGTAGWPDVALGGFHSQVGWLSFNAVGLGFVAITTRRRSFMVEAPARARGSAAAESIRADATTAYLAPLLAIVATSMVTGAFSAGFDWLYPARVLSAGAVLWMFRGHYAELRWKWSWSAIAIGAVAFAVWLALMPAEANDDDAWPAALGSIPVGWAALWLAIRIVGYVVTVPLAEELAFRGFLPRRLLRADFQNLPVARMSWIPVLISSLLFGALHGRFWLAGTIAGLLFAAALYRGKALGDAVQAHATTNALMVLYVCATGRWSAWS
jgi:exosortase E/protease (VPEID-CTERM system)